MVTYRVGVDLVFRALADPGRRALLDRLAEQDGLSVGELCEVLPEMTRFGVMKHLGVLESAHLITTERHGRRKLHYLNPVPIQQIHDRWISRYTAPFAQTLAGLTAAAERHHPDQDDPVRPHPQGETVGSPQAHLRDVHQSDAG